MMATNNGTYGVQNDTYAYSLNNSNISILIATRGGNIVVKKEVVKRQAAHICQKCRRHRTGVAQI